MTTTTTNAATASGPSIWLFNSTAAAVCLSAAVGFRVRHWPSGTRGAGGLIADPDTGLPRWPIDLEREDFYQKTQYRIGRYCLEPVDASGHQVADAAVVHITEEMAARAANARAADAAVLQWASKRRLVDEKLVEQRAQTALVLANARRCSELPDGPERAQGRAHVVVWLTDLLALDVTWRALMSDVHVHCADARHGDFGRWAYAVDDAWRSNLAAATHALLAMATDPDRPSLVH